MMPAIIYNELFDLTHPVSDITLSYIFDLLTASDLLISDYRNYDVMIIIAFYNKEKDLIGELRINRMLKEFEICIQCGKVLILPAHGDWDLVTEYLQKALAVLHPAQN